MKRADGSSKATAEFLRRISEIHVSRAKSKGAVTENGTGSGGPAGHQELARLVALEQRTLRSYFRLAEADRLLTARRRATQLERQRKRIGRQLHTSAGQALAGITIHLGILQELLPDPPEGVRRSLDSIRELAREALEQVEGISRGLYSPAWQREPIRQALRRLWETSGIAATMQGELDLQELPVEPPLEARAALYDIAQEGLTNVIRHSKAHWVRLSLRAQGHCVALEIADNGRGFNHARELEPGRASGIGLRSMREVAGQAGGELRIRSDSQGTTLSVSLPVTHE